MKLVDHHLKMHGTLTIPETAVIDDVLGPGSALDVDDTMNCGNGMSLI